MLNGKIRILPEDVIDEIAAGEVIERPSSVVKELLENSIDAKASRIDIFLVEGGKKQIVVVDDGEGMCKSDLEVCYLRYSTSKIHSTQDLTKIGTYGFRGEALASIASVSLLKIASREKDSDSGYELKIKRGHLIDGIVPVAMPIGTSVSVSEIFYDVPARLKFLRSEFTEYQHCARVIKELALVKSDIRFFLYHNGKLVTQYILPKVRGRLEECLKPNWQIVEISESCDDVKIYALLSEPCLMSDRGELYIYVNGRSVKNRELFAVIRKAYSESLGAHHEPCGAVFLEIRKDWVDANVHPQKTEVRCYQVERVFNWIKSIIRKNISINRTIMKIDFPLDSNATYLSEPLNNYNQIIIESKSSFSNKSHPSTIPKTEKVEQLAFEETKPHIKFIGQVKNSYILLEDATGLIIVDQHALHEKKRFHAIKDAYNLGSVNSQKLLIPKIINLKEELIQVFEKNTSLFESFGFDMEHFGSGDLVVKAYPELIDETLIEEIITECLYELMNETTNSENIMQKHFNSVFAKIACKSAVTANSRLSFEEVNGLINDIFDLKESLTCPHGRPILFRIDYSEIEKHFGRT